MTVPGAHCIWRRERVEADRDGAPAGFDSSGEEWCYIAATYEQRSSSLFLEKVR